MGDCQASKGHHAGQPRRWRRGADVVANAASTCGEPTPRENRHTSWVREAATPRRLDVAENVVCPGMRPGRATSAVTRGIGIGQVLPAPWRGRP